MKVTIELSEWGLATVIGMVNERISDLQDQEKKFHDPSNDRACLIRDFAVLLENLHAGRRLAQKAD